MNALDSSAEALRQAVEVFWDVFPPLWQRIRAHIHQTARERFGVSVEQFHILRHIRRGQGSVSELARVKNISRAAVSQAVDALVARGLVSRATDPRDRRHIHLALTESGQALLEAIFDETRQWMMRLLAPLAAEEVATLTQAMALLRKVEEQQ
ncbi:MAG: MarR family transcriptional regulator [Anaerolineales bacterium]